MSAYDLYYKKVSATKITFPEVVFLDCGGYEARVDYDLADAVSEEYRPKKWTRSVFLTVLRKWPRLIPTIAVSFDSPRQFLRLKDQIKQAAILQKEIADLPVELLVKPESKNADTVPIEAIIKNISELRQFTAIGLTEKELGRSMLEKMTKIARLRTAMDAAKVDIPIHIFGSLDTLSTPLYFVSGAEIFDGLTWLKYGYHEGSTIYYQNYGTIGDSNGLIRSAKDQVTEMWKNNYYYLGRLRDQMINYVRTEDFGQFKHIGAILNDAFQQLQARLTS